MAICPPFFRRAWRALPCDSAGTLVESALALKVGRREAVEALPPTRIDAACDTLDPDPVHVKGPQRCGFVLPRLGAEPLQHISVEVERDLEGRIVSQKVTQRLTGS